MLQFFTRFYQNDVLRLILKKVKPKEHFDVQNLMIQHHHYDCAWGAWPPVELRCPFHWDILKTTLNTHIWGQIWDLLCLFTTIILDHILIQCSSHFWNIFPAFLWGLHKEWKPMPPLNKPKATLKPYLQRTKIRYIVFNRRQNTNLPCYKKIWYPQTNTNKVT